jgi:hypothetical protein
MRVRRRDYGTKDEREQTIQRRRKRLRRREMESSSKLVEGKPKIKKKETDDVS